MKWFKVLYVQVLIGVILGILLGLLFPPANAISLFGHSFNATDLQPLAEIFIKAIKMLIAPIIFCTVVCGI
uniref:cation:dicarboxylate symporter family transporter n=1 Tax=Prosthecobacter sp. TaxID=1965333 RepID=UPI003784CD22